MNHKVSTNNPATQGNDAAVRITNQAKVRKIIERYFLKFDIEVVGNQILSHPVCSDNMWKPKINFSADAAIPKILSNPAKLEKVNDIAKAAIGWYVREQPLTDIFRSLHTPYSFKILQKAEKYLSTDDFSRLLRATWEASCFYFEDSAVFTREELVDLLNSCDPQSFMTRDEWIWFNYSMNPREVVFRGDVCDAFIWAFGVEGAIVSERFGSTDDNSGYLAVVNREDIFAVVKGFHTGYIVNPDKLRVKNAPDLRNYCGRARLDEIHDDWEDDDED